MQIFYSFLSIIIWLIFIATFLLLYAVFMLIWLFSFLFDSKRRILHRYTGLWARFLTLIIPFWNIKIEGLQHIDRTKQYIVCSNHQSMLDILILYRLNLDFKWIAKKELFEIPLFGWIMMMNRYIAINRGNKNSALDMYEKAEKSIHKNFSIMIFPEGTRSKDGRLGAFKEGAFIMAKRHQKDILPVVINGAYDAMPKGTFVFRKKATILVEVLPPINADTFQDLEPKEIAAKVKGLMSSTLKN